MNGPAPAQPTAEPAQAAEPTAQPARGPLTPGSPGLLLRVLVVDDEPPALEELAYLLGRDARIREVLTAGSGEQALRLLEHDDAVDAIFLDVAMPGLSGLDLARVLARFRSPTPVVFVTAHDEHAVEAFELHAVDYLLKPVRHQRLDEAVRRVVDSTSEPATGDDETIAVEGRVDGECRLTAVVAPPLDQPPMEEIRTRAGHRPDEVVPSAAEGLEAGPLRDGLGPQHASGPV